MHTGTAPRHASRSATMLPAMHTHMLFKQEIFFQVFQILTVISIQDLDLRIIATIAE